MKNRNMSEIKNEILRLLEAPDKKLAKLAREIGVSDPVLYNTLHQENRRIPATWIAPCAKYLRVTARKLLYFDKGGKN